MFRIVFPCFVSFCLVCSSLLGVKASESAMCQVYFSPKDDLAGQLITLIDEERDSIKCAIYCLTHSGIARALMRAQARGVSVDLIVDPQSFKGRTTLMQKMEEQQIPISVWDVPPKMGSEKRAKQRALMHDKFCVFGKNRVWTGSFNFTRGASATHCENAVVLENNQIAVRFLEEFERIKFAHCVSYAQFIQSTNRR